MNNFLEFINKDIDGKRVYIDTLPTKTKTNKKKFNETLEEFSEKYKEYEKTVFKYLTIKAKSFDLKEEKSSSEKLKNKVEELEHAKFLLNPANTYLEKMGFDTLLFQLNNYYTLNFKSLNVIINSFLDKFESAGINLQGKDFNYTCYVCEYMTSYLEVRASKTKDYTHVSEIFEQIYWLNPDIIQHIELNFRKLIKLNAKKLDAYIVSLQKEEMHKHDLTSYKDCLEKLQKSYDELNKSQVETVKDIIELSKAGALEIEHYLESSKIRIQAYQSLIADAVNLADKEKMSQICEALEKLKSNINELSGYLSFLPLFNDFKDRYKNMVSTNDTKKPKETKNIEVQIAKKEIELDKINRKINGTGTFFGKSKLDVKDLKMESIMKAKELHALYKELDEAYFNEEVMQVLSKTMTISDLLNLYYSFDYFKKMAIQKVYKLTNYDEIIRISEEFDLYAIDPNNIIIAGVPVFEDTNIARIICNKYHLSNIYLEEDNLTEENLKSLLNKVLLILRTQKIENSDITLEKIWFITKVHKYKINKEN